MQAGDSVIEAIEPRVTQLLRQDKAQGQRAVAANVNCMLVVATPAPVTRAEQIDRYLAIAELCGLEPILLANKADLPTYSAWASELAEFSRLGYTLLACSTKTQQGLAALEQAIAGKHSVLAGLSGAGKSSLINALIPDIDTRTAELSAASGEGRHTTTASRLYRLPRSGWIIDAPGVRDIRLWPMHARELAHGFIEFCEYLGQCRFNDCQHDNEPQCALRQAVEDGAVSARRYASFRKLVTLLPAPAKHL